MIEFENPNEGYLEKGDCQICNEFGDFMLELGLKGAAFSWCGEEEVLKIFNYEFRIYSERTFEGSKTYKWRREE